MSISKEITDTIKDEKFQEYISDITEVYLDSFLSEGIIKDIPILGLLLKTKNIFQTIQERLFTKKLYSFLKQLENIPTEKRINQIEKIDNDIKYQTKVGEKILYLINNAEDSEKSGYIGLLFKNFLLELISYDDFLRTVNCIDKINLVDLKLFLEKGFSRSERISDAYLNAGLITFQFLKPEKNDRGGIQNDYRVYFKKSETGILILKLLGTKKTSRF
ncbi:hypothetical protein J2X97_003261 [Epilithonimonas hungarica]|uniref:hypothetical protein n=1 Tax=Epilithonimonas hungarica TaxID=454006 RepID=UPI0027817E38|nr:hypothetical protein [Epilithonimonas hungarica]MDP9957592.1 hypothetical protein [Epilithonimonas hungarica]